MLSYDLNERLLTAVQSGDFEQALGCIMQGAQASYVSPTCGRTAVGTAAILGDAELLELLVQSCEEPELDVFHQCEFSAGPLMKHFRKNKLIKFYFRIMGFPKLSAIVMIKKSVHTFYAVTRMCFKVTKICFSFAKDSKDFHQVNNSWPAENR